MEESLSMLRFPENSSGSKAAWERVSAMGQRCPVPLSAVFCVFRDRALSILLGADKNSVHVSNLCLSPITVIANSYFQ